MRKPRTVKQSDEPAVRSRLKFASEKTEREFRASYWHGSLSYARFALISAAALGAAFGILDSLVAQYAVKELFIIRFGILVPSILIGYTLSFLPYFTTRYHIAIIPVTILVGACIISMIALIEAPASDYYYAGLIMVLFFNFTFLQLRLYHAIFVAIILTLGYESVAFYLCDLPKEAILNNTFFILATNYGGIFAGYTIELNRRRNFYQIRLIRREREKISKVQRRLEKMSKEDDLTGLKNRRELCNCMENMISRFLSTGDVTAIALIDLDNFKGINDSFGHVVGDRVLKAVGSILTGCVEKKEMVFRYGGDEFVVLFPGRTALQGASTALNISRSFCKWAKSSKAATSADLGMSIGVTEICSESDCVDSLLRQADEALYVAKRRGKGRIVAIPRFKVARREEV